MFSGGIWHRSMNENVERLKEFKKIKEIYSADLANTATILYFFWILIDVYHIYKILRIKSLVFAWFQP